MHTLGIVAILFLASEGADTPKTAAERQPTATDRRFAEKWLAYRLRLRNTPPSAAENFEAAALRNAGLAPRDRDLTAIKAGDVPAPLLDFPLAVGAIGTLRGGTFKILQRIGDKEARVDIYRPVTKEELTQRFRERFRSDPKLETVDVFLENYDVTGMPDDQQCKTSGCFVVTKTKTYTTVAGGTRTIFVIEPFDSSAAESIFKKAVQEELDAERKAEAEHLAALEKEGRERAAEERRVQMKHDQEAKAKRYSTLLKNARKLIDAKVYAGAEKMLRRIIDEAPGTETAREAQKELNALPQH
jgi:hypothetical protein